MGHRVAWHIRVLPDAFFYKTVWIKPNNIILHVKMKNKHHQDRIQDFSCCYLGFFRCSFQNSSSNRSCEAVWSVHGEVRKKWDRWTNFHLQNHRTQIFSTPRFRREYVEERRCSQWKGSYCLIGVEQSQALFQQRKNQGFWSHQSSLTRFRRGQRFSSANNERVLRSTRIRSGQRKDNNKHVQRLFLRDPLRDRW